MQNSTDIDKDILLLLSNSDSKVIERLYKQHYKTIAPWIYKKGGDENDAADICQESMVVLYQKSKDENFRLTCKITTYLFAISKNLWFKKVNSRRTEVLHLDDEQEALLEETHEADIKTHEEREMHYQQLDNALEMLGAPCNKILKAYYFGNKSMQEIANEYNYTNADNAKTQKYKCLARLKKIFYSTIAK